MISDRELRLLVDQSPLLIWRADARGARDFFNQRWLDFTGRALEQELGEGWLQGIHPHDRRAWREAHLDLARRRAPGELRYRLRRSDGQHRWLQEQVAPYADRDGNFAGFVGCGLDVSEAVQAGRDLDHFFAVSLDPMCVVGLDGHFRRVNPAFHRQLGHSQPELLSRPWLDLFHPDDRPAAMAAEKRLRAGQPVENFTARCPRPDGEVRWLAWTGRGIVDEGLIYAVARDVTPQVHAQAESREHQLRLSETQRLARLGSWRWDWDLGQGHWSEETYRILGLEPGTELVPLEEFIAQWVAPEDRAELAGAMQRARTTGEPIDVQYRFLAPGGRLIWARSMGEARRAPDGRVVGLVGTIQDITEAKLAEQRLVESQRRLAEAQRLAGMGSWEWDLPTGVVHWSEELYHLLGREPDQERMSFAQGLEYIHPQDRDWLEERARAALERDQAYDVIHRAVRTDGQIRVFHSRAEVVRDHANQPLRMVGLVQDVTAQRAAQEQLALAAKVLENSIEGVIITDAQGVIQSVNRAFTIITGFSPEEVRGRRPDLLRSGRHDQAFYAAVQRSLAENGEWRGEVWHRGKDGQDYPQWMTVTTIKDEMGAVTNQVILLHDISDLRRSEEELRYQTYHDALTGLPNRQLLRDRLEVAMAGANRRGRVLALIYVDLDNFKTINDSLGHAAGDLLLQTMANRLVDLYQGRNTVARLGGDDFVVVLEDLEDAEEAKRQAAALLEVLARPYLVEGEEFYLTTSLGLALFPAHGQQAEVMIKNAELAMYRAKEQGKNAVMVYAPTMNAVVLKRLSLETALRKALERDEFEVHYQPRVDVAAGRMLGMEALVRWRRPEVGLVSPGDFIPLAEETGLIVPIGGWVLRQACQQAKAWRDQGRPDLVVAVNLSARQLRHASLVATVEAALADSGLPPANLELELTESALMTNVDRAVALMQVLSRLGLRLALDDFGTGYSSLYYLKHFPIQALKIDQHFVADIFNDPDDAAIVRAVISLANSLKVAVVAEGVETVEQRDFLLAHGCREMQGYLFSRPLPSAEFQRLLERERDPRANPWARPGAA